MECPPHSTSLMAVVLLATRYHLELWGTHPCFPKDRELLKIREKRHTLVIGSPKIRRPSSSCEVLASYPEVVPVARTNVSSGTGCNLSRKELCPDCTRLPTGHFFFFLEHFFITHKTVEHNNGPSPRREQC